MRVCLFNAKFSPNLGDGLLSECLEKALEGQSDGDLHVSSIDVAARTSYEAGNTSRATILQLLHMMPESLRHAVLGIPLRRALRRTWLPHYQRMLEGADALVIGGGNLFTDMDLNFPTKMSAVIKAAKQRRIPVSIYGVGVSGEWSAKGLALMTDAFGGATVPYVSVRDDASKQNFDRLFADMVGKQAQVVRDPGLLISSFVPQVPTPQCMIGLNIMSAVAVRYHSTFKLSDATLLRWYAAVYHHLIAANYQVRVFTNGSPEDVKFANQFMQNMGIDQSVKTHVLRPVNPSHLAKIVSECRLVIAFRMHAIIAAHSYGVDVIALQWDKKVKSFMESIGRSEQIFSVEKTTAEMLTAKIKLISQSSYKKSTDDKVIREATKDVRNLANIIRST